MEKFLIWIHIFFVQNIQLGNFYHRVFHFSCRSFIQTGALNMPISFLPHMWGVMVLGSLKHKERLDEGVFGESSGSICNGKGFVSTSRYREQLEGRTPGFTKVKKRFANVLAVPTTLLLAVPAALLLAVPTTLLLASAERKILFFSVFRELTDKKQSL